MNLHTLVLGSLKLKQLIVKKLLVLNKMYICLGAENHPVFIRTVLVRSAVREAAALREAHVHQNLPPGSMRRWEVSYLIPSSTFNKWLPSCFKPQISLGATIPQTNIQTDSNRTRVLAVG